MNLKRKSLIVLILGLLVFVLGLMAPIIYWSNYTSRNGTSDIIGGADTPTYTFMLFSLFDGLPLVLVLLGVSLLISAGFCLLFSKTVIAHCTIKTSVISIGLSGIGALGLVCAFLWFTIVSYHEMSKHPVEYPVSILLGMICFIAFLALIVFYSKARKTNWAIKGIIIDVFTSIMYLPTFFFAFAYLYETIT